MPESVSVSALWNAIEDLRRRGSSLSLVERCKLHSLLSNLRALQDQECARQSECIREQLEAIVFRLADVKKAIAQTAAEMSRRSAMLKMAIAQSRYLLECNRLAFPVPEAPPSRCTGFSMTGSVDPSAMGSITGFQTPTHRRGALKPHGRPYALQHDFRCAPMLCGGQVRWEVQHSDDGQNWHPPENGAFFLSEVQCRVERNRLAGRDG